MDYSDCLYVYYTGPDAWGQEVTEAQHDEFCAELEHRVKERFPGIFIKHTLDPYVVGVSVPFENEDQLESMHDEVNAIVERVLSGKPEPEL